MGRPAKVFRCESCGSDFRGWTGNPNRFCGRTCANLAMRCVHVEERTPTGLCPVCESARVRRYQHSERGRAREASYASRKNTLRALQEIRARRGRITEQIRELSAQLLVGQEDSNGE